jgi:hypothetical protein
MDLRGAVLEYFLPNFAPEVFLGIQLGSRCSMILAGIMSSPVRTENLVRFDLLTESLNPGRNGRADASIFKPKSWLEAENAALRQQPVVLHRQLWGRVQFTNSDHPVSCTAGFH